MKILSIIAVVVAAVLVALWLWEPLVVYGLFIAVWAGALSLVAGFLNLVLPADEQRVRIEAKVFLDGVEQRAAGIANCRRDRKSTRLNSSHIPLSRMPSSA